MGLIDQTIILEEKENRHALQIRYSRASQLARPHDEQQVLIYVDLNVVDRFSKHVPAL